MSRPNSRPNSRPSSRPQSPTSPRRGKTIVIKVLMLDNTVNTFHVAQKASGRHLYEDVVNKLQLLEADYFDLEYINQEGVPCWLDHDKPVLKQVGSPQELNFRFGVKFYTPDPGLLEDEYTRYLFALQIKRDLQTGVMPCNENTAALLASYITQAELGDFIDEFTDQSYFQSCKIMQNQTPKIEEKIIDHHKIHIGMTPAEADFNLLDTARKVELYGIKMCSARVSTDHESCGLNLACAHMGVLVFQNYTKINTFSWAKIRKLSFKRKKFLIKLHPEGYFQLDFTAITEGFYKDTVEFYFETRNDCKNFWKRCIEHHAFFRCQSVKRLPRNKTRVVSRGSSFRYGGRTQKQLVEWVRENHAKRAPFDRSASARLSSRAGDGVSVSRTSTLNTADHHQSHNSTSSGSHTLDISSKDNMDHPRIEHQENVDIHSSHSSVGSPTRRSEGDMRSLDRESVGLRSRELSLDKDEPDDLPPPPPPPPLQHDTGDRNGAVVEAPRSSKSPGPESARPHYPAYPAPDHHYKSVDREAKRRSRDSLGSPLGSLGSPLGSPERTNDMNRVSDERGMRTSSPRINGGHLSRPVVRHQSPELIAKPPAPVIRQETAPEARTPDRVEQHGAFVPTNESFNLSAENRSQYTLGDEGVYYTCTSRSQTFTNTLSTGTSGSGQSNKSEDSGDDASKNYVESTFTLQRYPADKSYFIAKELLMTERTYKKDLEVLTVWFRNMVCRDNLIPEYLSQLIFSHLDTIYENHSVFLKDLEQRVLVWEGKTTSLQGTDHRRIGDLMLGNTKMLQLYRNYISKLEEILTEMDRLVRVNKLLERAYKDFESQKVCYLPLNTFLLKPAHRLLHYKLILDRLLKYYSQDHPDYRDCKVTLTRICEIVDPCADVFERVDNLQKMLELQWDLIGIDFIVQKGRRFVREGCLQKLSKKGYQQRMFFLFSDVLIYTSRTTTPTLQFKVHGQIPLRGMTIEEADPKIAVPHSFTIYGSNRCLLVAASCEPERERWLEDLHKTIDTLKQTPSDSPRVMRVKSQGSFDDLDGDMYPPQTPPMGEKQVQHRANTTMHVCWHRNTSVSMLDHQYAIRNQLSGYVLRKFKNTNGWQKLWVVFTNFCLYFYKTFQDDFPLASLPLLGYCVNVPEQEDQINKDFVFKLQFKNHVYFFRAESDYTFRRWMEVIGSATNTRFQAVDEK